MPMTDQQAEFWVKVALVVDIAWVMVLLYLAFKLVAWLNG